MAGCLYRLWPGKLAGARLMYLSQVEFDLVHQGRTGIGTCLAFDMFLVLEAFLFAVRTCLFTNLRIVAHVSRVDSHQVTEAAADGLNREQTNQYVLRVSCAGRAAPLYQHVIRSTYSIYYSNL